MQYKHHTVRAGLLVSTLALLAAACSDDDVGGPDPDPDPTNRAPTASVSANPLNIPQGDNHQTVITIDGTASSDPDGDQLSYSWTVPGGSFVNGTGPNDAIVQVTFPGVVPYDVELVVDDGNGNTASTIVTIGIL